jgi:hypothetical protein
MRRIFTISIDPDLENEVEEYLKTRGLETKSEGAIQLLKKGLRYDNDIKELQSKQNQIHLPCSICGKPFTISESDDNPIYKDMKTTYSKWAHGDCTEANRKKKK